MQKSKYKIGLVWAFIALAFAIVAGVLFFVCPMVDAAIGGKSAGYEPLALLVKGINALVSFNFEQTGYLYVLICAGLMLSALIYWLIMILVKKVYKRLVAWVIILVAGVVAILIGSAYILAPLKAVTLYGGESLVRYVYKDLLNDYASMRLEDGVTAPFVFNTGIGLILGYVTAIVAYATLIIAFIKPLVDAIVLGCPNKEQRQLKRAEKERLEEERRQMIAEIEEKRRNELIAYVDYVSNKPTREEEYEEICAKAGVEAELTPEQRRIKEVTDLPFFKEKNFQYKAKEEAQDEPAKPVHSDAYYKETAKGLGVLGGDQAYYDETIRDLGILNGEAELRKEEEAEDSYYEETARDLAILHDEGVEAKPEEVSSEDYYAETAAQLRVLKLKEAKPEMSDEEYYAMLKKELPALQHQNLGKPENKEDTYDVLYKELVALRLAKQINDEEQLIEALRSLKERALKGSAYYEVLEKELECLKYQKPPVEPEVK